MSREIEIRGQTVDEAVDAGLEQLGLQRNDVIVDVIDEGSKGILGLGAREAVVRLLPMTPAAPEPKSEPAPARHSKPTMPTQTAPPRTVPQPESAVPAVSTEEMALERDTAVAILETMLNQMQVEAQITPTVTEPDDITGRPINLIQITGDDLGVLIGPRGDTLTALQYVTRLIASHQLKGKVDFVIDVEGYRERRKQALARLAERMASKVIKQRRPVSLEPMPANERRIIHMTLREHPAVYTQSTGEGSHRRVRILLKR